MKCNYWTGTLGLLLFANVGIGFAESPLIAEARAFRVQVYQFYRQDRARYNELRRFEHEIAEQWKAAGRPADREAELLAWYQAARVDLKPLLLPTPPDFSELIAQREAELKHPPVEALSNSVPTPPPSLNDVVANPGANLSESHAPEAPHSSVSKSLARALWKAFTE